MIINSFKRRVEYLTKRGVNLLRFSALFSFQHGADVVGLLGGTSRAATMVRVAQSASCERDRDVRNKGMPQVSAHIESVRPYTVFLTNVRPFSLHYRFQHENVLLKMRALGSQSPI